jgi:hypothetical protein
MNQKVMLVEKERFLLNDNCKYMITGRVSKEADIECYLDGIRLLSEANLITVMTGFMRAVETKNPGGKWVEVLVTLPENLQSYKKLEVYAVNGKERFLWYKMKTPDLMRKQGKPQLFCRWGIYSQRTEEGYPCRLGSRNHTGFPAGI